MKNLKLLILAVLLSFSFLPAVAQTQFDYLGGLSVDANSTGCFYLDLNTGGTNLGINDVKFVHGGGDIYFDAIYADSLKLPYTQFRSGQKFWKDCAVDNSFTESKVYLIKGIHHLSLGSHVLPFKYNGLYNFVVVRIDDNSHISIRGWVFNIPAETYECYILADQ